MSVNITEVRYRPVPVRASWTLRSGGQVRRKRNLLTNDGLTQLAANWAGQGKPPLYLIISNFKATLVDATLAVGALSLTLSAPVHQAGDTSFTLNVGGANQEALAFTSTTNNGDGSCTYTLSGGTTKTHSAGEWADRTPNQNDTLAAVVSEVQYDAVAAPNARMKASGIGFSSGSGSYTTQFYLTGNQAVTPWVSLGLSDTGVVRQGLLHHHLLFGFDHQQGNDVELDVTLTLQNG